MLDLKRAKIKAFSLPVLTHCLIDAPNITGDYRFLLGIHCHLLYRIELFDELIICNRRGLEETDIPIHLRGVPHSVRV